MNSLGRAHIMNDLTAWCVRVRKNSDIFRPCESLKMQTGLYVTQWPARSALLSNLSSPYTS